MRGISCELISACNVKVAYGNGPIPLAKIFKRVRMGLGEICNDDRKMGEKWMVQFAVADMFMIPEDLMAV